MADLPAGGRWVTINGAPVYIDSGGKVVAGAGGAVGGGSSKGGGLGGDATRIRNPEAAAKEYSAHQDSFYKTTTKSHTPQETIAVGRFASGKGKTMQKQLRKDPRIKEGSEAETLQSAIEKAAPTPQSATVIRHMSDFPVELPAAGTTMQLQGFTSASLQSHLPALKAGGVSMEIKVPAGSKGVLSGFNPRSQEFLFKHGAKMKYVGSSTRKYGSSEANAVTNTTHFFEYEG
jgi:hypothetical protein